MAKGQPFETHKQRRLRLRREWAKRARSLVGGKIVGVRWMHPDEQNSHDWQDAAPILEVELANGEGVIAIYPSADDEGNNAGALFTTSAKIPTLPVI